MMLLSALLVCALFIHSHVSIKYVLASEEECVNEPFPQEKCESLLENCLCYDYDELAGISCNNVTDFSKFSSLLANNTIFHCEDTTYEIILNKLEYLPPRSIEGLIVYRLYLVDPNLSVIDKDAFQGAKRLRKFHIRRSSIKEIPEFHSINDSLRSINIDNSHLTALTGERLHNLPLVKKLSLVNNSISYIDPNAFKGTHNISILDLSYNLLTSLPSGILDPLENITKLVLSHNQLIQVDHLFAVHHPRFIYLDFNNISNVESVLVKYMTNVETLFLTSNPIKKVSNQSFNVKIPRVRFLHLDHCQLQEFDVTHYESLINLATLDLSHNLIEEISQQTINIGVNLELDLFGNNIRRFEGELTYKIKRVYLDENELQALGRTLQYSQVVEVSVASNHLQYLSAEDFRGVHATANLELQNNQIQWIDELTFLNIKNDLHYLDLSANRIRALNGSVKYLSQLKLLNVSENMIQSFATEEFIGLNELSELYLQRNYILALSGQIRQIPQLQYIVVTQNKIQTMRPEQLPEKLKYIYFEDNPFRCDCRLLPFLQWLNTSTSPATDIELCVPNTKTNNKYQQYHKKCPEMCDCTCTEDTGDYFMTVNCSSQNLTVLPDFLTGSFFQIDNTSITFDFGRSLVFDMNTDPRFHISNRVRGIDLSNNSLESLDTARFPTDLIHLHISKNQLRTLSESMLYDLSDLRMVTLSENPWDCDCNAVAFKKWIISKIDVVQDINNTRCSVKENSESHLDGKPIWTLTDLDLCPANIAMYVLVSFGVLTFLLLCLTSKIMYTKYELNIKVYLYSRGFTWVKARDIDYDKQFDAFISFSHRDEVFVSKEIIAGIENRDPNIRLCVHYRDFRAGEFIHDNIIYAVQNSKRTVLVLSNNFLESEWCLMEFRAAHVQALEDKVHRIIVIKVGDLPKDIDPAIKVYLDSTTYLTWGDKYFWNNLLYVLPTSSTPRESNSIHKDVKLNRPEQRPNFKAIQA